MRNFKVFSLIDIIIVVDIIIDSIDDDFKLFKFNT